MCMFFFYNYSNSSSRDNYNTFKVGTCDWIPVFRLVFGKVYLVLFWGYSTFLIDELPVFRILDQKDQDGSWVKHDPRLNDPEKIWVKGLHFQMRTPEGPDKLYPSGPLLYFVSSFELSSEGQSRNLTKVYFL